MQRTEPEFERSATEGAPMSDPRELNELVDIGLVTKVSGIFPLGKREGDQPETAAIRLQMESLSGKIYFASLTLEAARNMVLGLSNCSQSKISCQNKARDWR